MGACQMELMLLNQDRSFPNGTDVAESRYELVEIEKAEKLKRPNRQNEKQNRQKCILR
ncbi:hypothetical protein CANARDRAFT_19958, partial [[Candida] arabinofermentans NRRL YB-2248]